MSDARLFSRLPGPCVVWFARAVERGILTSADRALAATLADLAGGIPPEILGVYAVSAALTSAVSREGHTLLDLGAASGSPYLDDLPDSLPAPSRWPGILAPVVVGSPEDPGPLILDKEGLYLYRYYCAEVRVAETIGRRLIRDRGAPPFRPIPPLSTASFPWRGLPPIPSMPEGGRPSPPFPDPFSF